jgi:hypothetical protein
MIPPNQHRLGIDHPVVSVRTPPEAVEKYKRLGFSPSPISYHPWGSVLTVMMFENNFIELIGIDNPAPEKWMASVMADSVYGLAAYVFTNDLTTALRVTEKIDAGCCKSIAPAARFPACRTAARSKAVSAPNIRLKARWKPTRRERV